VHKSRAPGIQSDYILCSDT